MYNKLHLGIKKMTRAFLLGLFVLAAARAEGAASLNVEQSEAAYIGCEVVLSLGGDATGVADASYE